MAKVNAELAPSACAREIQPLCQTQAWMALALRPASLKALPPLPVPASTAQPLQGHRMQSKEVSRRADCSSPKGCSGGRAALGQQNLSSCMLATWYGCRRGLLGLQHVLPRWHHDGQVIDEETAPGRRPLAMPPTHDSLPGHPVAFVLSHTRTTFGQCGRHERCPAPLASLQVPKATTVCQCTSEAPPPQPIPGLPTGAVDDLERAVDLFYAKVMAEPLVGVGTTGKRRGCVLFRCSGLSCDLPCFVFCPGLLFCP